MTEIIVGIDLGTTYSAIAWVDPADNRPQVIANLEGELTTPSIALVEENGDIVVGEQALRLQNIGDNAKRTVRMVKRNIGTDWQCFADTPYVKTPEQISAAILSKLIADAEVELGDKKITGAVISVPAYFDNDPRRATLKAGELAGIQVRQLIDEPVAASFVFGIEKLQPGDRVLVYDLGGGTFDASILEKQGDKLQVLSTQGSRQLGGYDWSAELKKIVVQKYEEQTGEEYDCDLAQEVDFERELEKTKKTLSKLFEAEFSVPTDHGPVIVEINRPEFETATAYLVQQTMTKCRQALEMAKLEWQDLAHVLLVGGSSRMPAISAAIAEERCFGREPYSFGSPDLLVAQGAALQARGYLEPKEYDQNPDIVYLTNQNQEVKLATILTTAHAFGTIVNKEGKYAVSHIIPAGERYPLSVAREDYNVPAGATSFLLPVVQGGIDGAVKGEDGDHTSCISKATYKFTGIPARPAPSAVKVEFQYDSSQIIEVKAWDVESNELLVGEKIPLQLPELKVESAGQSVVIALDCSASMRGKELKSAKKEIIKLAKQHLKKGTVEMAIVNFGGDYEVFPAAIVQDFTTDVAQIKETLKKLEADNTTPMAEGFKKCRQLLEIRNKSNNLISLVVISDGAPNAERKALEALEQLKQYHLKCYAIAVGAKADKNFMAQIGPYVDIESSSGISKAVNHLLCLDSN